MAKIVWAEEARTNLRAIYGHIAQDNPPAADRTLDGIYERVEQLATYPLIGHRVEWESSHDLRSLNYGHYRVVYFFANETVLVLGVFHGAVDIRRHLPDIDPGNEKQTS